MPTQYKSVFDQDTGTYYVHIKGGQCTNFTKTTVSFVTKEALVKFISKHHVDWVYVDKSAKTIEPTKPKNIGPKRRRLRRLVV